AHTYAGHAHGAAGMRAAADRNDVGVALHEADGLERYTEPFAHALSKARLVPLPARQRADRDLDLSARQHFHLRPFARIAHGELDVVRQPTPPQLAFRFRFSTPPAELLPLRHRHAPVHRLLVVAVVIGDAKRRAVRQLLGRDEIAPPDLDAVDAGLERC